MASFSLDIINDISVSVSAGYHRLCQSVTVSASISDSSLVPVCVLISPSPENPGDLPDDVFISDSLTAFSFSAASLGVPAGFVGSVYSKSYSEGTAGSPSFNDFSVNSLARISGRLVFYDIYFPVDLSSFNFSFSVYIIDSPRIDLSFDLDVFDFFFSAPGLSLFDPVSVTFSIPVPVSLPGPIFYVIKNHPRVFVSADLTPPALDLFSLISGSAKVSPVYIHSSLALPGFLILDSPGVYVVHRQDIDLSLPVSSCFPALPVCSLYLAQPAYIDVSLFVSLSVSFISVFDLSLIPGVPVSGPFLTCFSADDLSPFIYLASPEYVALNYPDLSLTLYPVDSASETHECSLLSENLVFPGTNAYMINYSISASVPVFITQEMDYPSCDPFLDLTLAGTIPPVFLSVSFDFFQPAPAVSGSVGVGPAGDSEVISFSGIPLLNYVMDSSEICFSGVDLSANYDEYGLYFYFQEAPICQLFKAGLLSLDVLFLGYIY